jgi:hypothetical protein
MAESRQPSDTGFVEALLDTNLYSRGADFADQNP